MDRLVQQYERHCVTTALRASKVKSGDIDTGVTERLSDLADGTWNVIVTEIEHVGADLRLYGNTINLDNSRLVAAEQRSRYGPSPAAGTDRQANQRLIVARLIILGLADADVSLACDRWRVDYVYALEKRRQQPHQRGPEEESDAHAPPTALGCQAPTSLSKRGGR